MNLTNFPPSLNSMGLSDFFFLIVFPLRDGSWEVSEEEDSELDVEDKEVLDNSCCTPDWGPKQHAGWTPPKDFVTLENQFLLQGYLWESKIIHNAQVEFSMWG